MILTPAGSKVTRMIAADKILADFGLRIFSWISLMLKGAESSFLYNQLGVNLVPVEHIVIDTIPEIAQVM